MRRLIIVICYVLITLLPKFTHAAATKEYEEASTLHMAAAMSIAAYYDRIGKLANHYLTEKGWEIDNYKQEHGADGARFLLAKSKVVEGKQYYMLAFVGTETKGDLGFNLKLDKVYFAGNSKETFAANVIKKGVPNTEPKVHRGFYEFMQSGLKAKAMEMNSTPIPLDELLLTHKDYKIYLVGHSLGGAAATLTGAALLEIGVRPEQIEVITFGAPAVGNAAFANKYNSVLNLKRVVVSGDPITGILQGLFSDYKQFGQEIRWELPDYRDQKHKMSEYMDLVLKNYYEKRQQVLQSKNQVSKTVGADPIKGQNVYIAPLKNNLPPRLAKEFWYMCEALRDEYQEKLPGAILASENDVDNWKEKAVAYGCKWAIVPEVTATQLQQEQNEYYVAVTQFVYNVETDSIVEANIYSTATRNFTPLESFIHAIMAINGKQDAWIMHTN